MIIVADNCTESTVAIAREMLVECTADGIRGTVREGELVSRWRGDDFLVAGPGERPDTASIQARLESYVRNSEVSLVKNAVGIQVWFVSGNPNTTTFESLVAQASTQGES